MNSNSSTNNSSNKSSNISKSSSVNPLDIVKRTLVGLKGMWWLVPILAAIGALGFVLNAYRSYTPTYTATATLIVSPKSSTISSYSGGVSSQQLEKTFPYIITSSQLVKIIGKDLGTGYMPGSVYASTLGETNLFTITAISDSYEMAYKLLKSVINNYSEVAEYIVGDTDLVIVVPPTASAEPNSTVSYRQNALIGTGAGTGLALVIITMIEMFNITVRKPDDVEDLLNSRKVGTIVKVIRKRSSNSSSVVSLDHLKKQYFR